MSRLGSAVSWISFLLTFLTLTSTYWFYFPPNNWLEGFLAITFCLVTAWLVSKLLRFLIKVT